MMDTQWVEINEFAELPKFSQKLLLEKSSLFKISLFANFSPRFQSDDFHSRSRAWLRFFGIRDFMTSATTIDVVDSERAS